MLYDDDYFFSFRNFFNRHAKAFYFSKILKLYLKNSQESTMEKTFGSKD
jgi:hypothetical protein